MKFFSKFKNFSRDLKLIIITALIASCVGVYAAGECIISATADDVSYNNTTVQAAIDELYSMASSYCPEGYECKVKPFYEIISTNAVLDNISSTYVTNSTGIKFNAISSNTNGKGIYEVASTANDPYPIYYYRGAVDNNNVKFGGFCWKIIRTTDTGGVKIIYNGEPDGSGNCTNKTGEASQIGTSKFYSDSKSLSGVGYMYGTTYQISWKFASNLNTTLVFGNDVTYSGGTYTLTNTMTTTGTWSNDYTTLNNNHYTCLNSSTTCSSVFYVYYTHSSNGVFYITLTNGKKVEDAIDDMLNDNNINTNDSTAKTAIDNWYSTYLSNYTNYIEDTVYCNDRSISELNGWNPNGGDTTKRLYFSPYTRAWNNYSPSLTCTREIDRFTVSSSNGNGALTYPVGLITTDEVMYAGGKANTNNNTYYLYTNKYYWNISPYSFLDTDAHEFYVDSTGIISGNYFVGNQYGLRPVVSLKSTDVVVSGDGTASNPYVIKTS